MAEASIMHEGVMGTTEGEQWRSSRQSSWEAACKSEVCRKAHILWKSGIFNASSRRRSRAERSIKARILASCVWKGVAKRAEWPKT